MIAPLDWGLGHATRCIPLIRQLLARNCDVIIAGSGLSFHLLRNEFPHLTATVLPGHAIRYAPTSSQMWKIAAQLPRLLTTYLQEHRATERIVARYGIDLVISDNRYGCRSEQATNVFIGHQVNLLLPQRLNLLSPAVNRIHSWVTAKFDRWWVPDYPAPDGVAGALSASDLPGLRYIGPLSRFGRIEKRSKTFDAAFILSGPEPQRTLLEKKVLDLVRTADMKFALVRGTATKLDIIAPLNLSVFDLIGSGDVADIIAASDIVVARSGYSTVMDLYCSGARAVFVPTPGQTEQEYLACRMAELGYAGYVEQGRMDLPSVKHAASAYRGFPGKGQDDLQLRRALDEVLGN